MANQIEKLSVFFPAYNEAENIASTVNKATKVLNNFAQSWEILIVNDGSNDDTLKIANRLASENRNIKVLNHPVNRGYGAAFKSGLYQAKYPWIAFTDADGQFDFSEITKFIEKQKETGADMVIGFYLDRKVSAFTKITSKLWELVVFILFGLKVKDIDCGFKMMSKKVVEKVPALESERGAFISSEFLLKAKNAGFKIVEIGVNHYPRQAGKPTGRKLNVIVKSFTDLLKLWKKLH